MTAKNGFEVVMGLRIEETAKALIHNHFTVDILDNLPAALDFFKNNLLPEIAPKTVCVGGSETVTHSGIYDMLRGYPDLDFINPYDPTHTPELAAECRRQGLISDLFVTSSNAVTMDGQLVNLDGLGNRVGGITFGPKRVVLFIGRNKICEDLETARQRVKNIAAPANAVRLQKKTPCTKTGYCMDCSSPGRICSVWSIMEKCLPAGRIHVLLINEDLGF